MSAKLICTPQQNAYNILEYTGHLLQQAPCMKNKEEMNYHVL